MMRQPITVVLVFDDRHARHAAVVLGSASDSLATGHAIDAHCIVAGLSDDSKAGLRRVEASLDNVQIKFHESDTARYDDWLHGGHISAAAYLRLELAEHIETEKAIYLDTDVLCLDSLHALHDIDLQGRPVGAVRDPSTPTVSSRRGIVRHESLGLSPDTPYFNSGILLIDVAKWRRAEPVAAGAAYISEHGEVQQALDQEVLNVVFANNWSLLPLRWNVSPRLINLESWADDTAQKLFRHEAKTALDDPAIVHFVGPRKPWDFRSSKEWTEIYMGYASQSPFYSDRQAYLAWRMREAIQWSVRRLTSWRRRIRRKLREPT